MKKLALFLTTLLVAVHTAAANVIPQESTTQGSVEPGAWTYYQVEIPADSPGWLLVLRVTSGEADLFIRQTDAATPANHTAKSDRTGSDGIVHPLSTSNGAGETWFLAFNAAPSAQWTLLTGDLHVRDIGAYTGGERLM